MTLTESDCLVNLDIFRSVTHTLHQVAVSTFSPFRFGLMFPFGLKAVLQSGQERVNTSICQ